MLCRASNVAASPASNCTLSSSIPPSRLKHFSYPEHKRRHLQQRIHYGHSHSLEYDTIKFRSPNTFVIRKTQREYTRQLEMWKQDMAEFQAQLAQMRSGFVSDLLGGDILLVSGIQEELNAPSVLESNDVPPTRPLVPLPAAAQNIGQPQTVAGTKRKADVIDLTEDDPPPSEPRREWAPRHDGS